jgi:hypothetical protein
MSDYAVVVEHVSPRQLAAVSGTAASPADIGPTIIRLLDNIWPLLRSQGVCTGHNVVMYFGGAPMRLAAGVEVPNGFQPTDLVQLLSTPEGEAATTVHWGDYAGMHVAYAALDRWCAASTRRTAGVNWEVYGDWFDDPAKVRTDIFMLLAPGGSE